MSSIEGSRHGADRSISHLASSRPANYRRVLAATGLLVSLFMPIAHAANAPDFFSSVGLTLSRHNVSVADSTERRVGRQVAQGAVAGPGIELQLGLAPTDRLDVHLLAEYSSGLAPEIGPFSDEALAQQVTIFGAGATYSFPKPIKTPFVSVQYVVARIDVDDREISGFLTADYTEQGGRSRGAGYQIAVGYEYPTEFRLGFRYRAVDAEADYLDGGSVDFNSYQLFLTRVWR